MVLGTCISLVLGTRARNLGTCAKPETCVRLAPGLCVRPETGTRTRSAPGTRARPRPGTRRRSRSGGPEMRESRPPLRGVGGRGRERLSGPRRGRDVGFGFPYLGYYRAKISAEDVAGELLNARGGRDATGSVASS